MVPAKDAGETSGVILSRTTLIPLGVAFGILMTLFSAWGYLDSRFNSVDKALEKQDRRLEKLEDATVNRWTAVDMKLWVSELRRLNPELKVPE